MLGYAFYYSGNTMTRLWRRIVRKLRVWRWWWWHFADCEVWWWWWWSSSVIVMQFCGWLYCARTDSVWWRACQKELQTEVSHLKTVRMWRMSVLEAQVGSLMTVDCLLSMSQSTSRVWRNVPLRIDLRERTRMIVGEMTMTEFSLLHSWRVYHTL